jgi:hypothetical protein
MWPLGERRAGAPRWPRAVNALFPVPFAPFAPFAPFGGAARPRQPPAFRPSWR